MKLETAKSLLLIVLIGTSLILTFGMWNYQPERDYSTEGESVDEVNLGGTRETKGSLITPTNIIFKENESYYGFVDPINRGNLYENMQTWDLHDFRTHVGDDRDTKAYEIEVMFPEAFPIELLGSIFSFGDEDITMPGWSFDRIYITFDTETKSIELSIPSIDKRDMATAVVNNPSQYDELWAYMTDLNSDDFRAYTLFDEGEKNIYLPTGEIKLPKKFMRYVDIHATDMVEILFPKPSVVTNSTVPNRGITYFSDSRQLLVGKGNLAMEYVNPYTENMDSNFTAVDLLEKSINNINSNQGWTGNFKLTKLNVAQKQVEYQMYFQGYPVFNNSNPSLSVIEQVWNSQQLEEYRRPLYRLSTSWNETEVELDSGENFLNELLTHPEYTADSIQDIMIGYRLGLELDEKGPYIELEPHWYVKNNGTWKVPSFNNELPTVEGGE